VRSLALLAGALDDSWELHALAPRGPAARVLACSGVRVHEAPVPAIVHTWDAQYHGLRWLVLGRELSLVPAHTRALRRALREIRPAIVHMNDSVAIASAAIAAREGVPVVWHLRSALANGGRDMRSRWICDRLDRYGAAAVAIDEDVAATFSLRIPLHVVPNPVMVEAGPEAALGIPGGRIVIGSFGYLRRLKGWPELLGALRILVDSGIEAHVAFVGGPIRPATAFRWPRGLVLRASGVPDEETDFRRTVADLGLEPYVTVIPFVADPMPYLRAADIVVFPNQGVGLGRPVLEGLALGKPVVASGSRRGAGFIVPGETGLLVTKPGAGPLAEALAQLVADPELRGRLGAEAARHVSPNTPVAAAARVSEIWAGVLARR